jgi:hypothetical protein
MRGSPLGAKIGIAILPILFAWPIVFRGVEWFDGLGGRGRHRWRGLGLVSCGFGLLGLSALLWGWSA